MKFHLSEAAVIGGTVRRYDGSVVYLCVRRDGDDSIAVCDEVGFNHRYLHTTVDIAWRHAKIEIQ